MEMQDSVKIAYLIIAHNEADILNKQIALLDWPGNDIYVLLDSKAHSIANKIRWGNLVSSIPEIIQYDNSISWGGYSLIKAELYLMKKAIERSKILNILQQKMK